MFCRADGSVRRGPLLPISAYRSRSATGGGLASPRGVGFGAARFDTSSLPSSLRYVAPAALSCVEVEAACRVVRSENKGSAPGRPAKY
jgi:hypothetical protein